MPVLVQIVLATLAVMNVVAFVAFGVDKRRARLGVRRTPEATLLGLAFATGLVGAWVGMSVFRHKTSKTSFKLKMVGVSIVNLAWPALWLVAETLRER